MEPCQLWFLNFVEPWLDAPVPLTATWLVHRDNTFARCQSLIASQTRIPLNPQTTYWPLKIDQTIMCISLHLWLLPQIRAVHLWWSTIRAQKQDHPIGPQSPYISLSHTYFSAIFVSSFSLAMNFFIKTI